VLALKKNHPGLYDQVEQYLQEKAIRPENRLEDHFDDGHGRLVRRRYFAADITHLPICQEWKGLRSAIAVEVISSSPQKPGEVTAQWRYYLTSHSADTKALHLFVRHHWGIENKLHWVLDVLLGEDADRKAERNSARAFAALKRMAVNIVRKIQPNSTTSLRSRIKLAGWDAQLPHSIAGLTREGGGKSSCGFSRKVSFCPEMVSSAKTPRKKDKILQKNNPLSKQAEQQSSLYEPKNFFPLFSCNYPGRKRPIVRIFSESSLRFRGKVQRMG